MNIAIVDDEKIELETAETFLRHYIKNFWAKYEALIHIETFTCAGDFLTFFCPKLYHLVILGGRMKFIANFLCARGDDDVNIVFLTANDNFILNGYRVFAIGYFIKPISEHEDDFINAFNHVFNKIRQKTPEIALNVGGNKFSVPFRNILYVDIDYRHRLCVYFADGQKFVTSNNYTDISEILSQDERFLECYHRIIVNMDYIKSMEPDDFTLLDGTSIPISQRKKKESKLKYIRYFVNK